jgi:two-component system, LuxR family, sensor kinase FixL
MLGLGAHESLTVATVKRISAGANWLAGWRQILPGPVPGLLAIALGLSIIAAVALSFNLARLRESFAWVEHTNEILRNIAAAERALLEAESGERGYLLTGENSYLDSYNRSQAQIPGLLDTLNRSVSDNPGQTQLLSELRQNIDARLAEFKQAVELGPLRLNDALAVLSTARSHQLTPVIERQLARFRQTELSLLEDRQRTVDRVAVLGTFIAAALGLLALLSTAVGAFLLERQRVIKQLRNANSDLEQSQKSLRDREARIEAVLATVPDAMVTIDAEGHIQSFSATAERLFGFRLDEVQRRNVSMLMPSPYRQEHDGYLNHYLATGEQRIIGKERVVVGQRKDGSTFPMELFVGEILLGDTRQFVGFVRDLTQRNEREGLLHEVQSELFHVSRLSTMGEMASALAHELNQPLAAMVNYLKGSRRLLDNSTDPQAESIKGAMDKAADQAIRAGQVIQRLRDFVARGETEKSIESINKLIEESSALALVSAKQQSVRVSFIFDPTIDFVLIDKIQIQQVLVNLLRNALEAMQDSARRELAISTAPEPDDMALVSVTDTGSGIDPEIASKLFQPFVSTKRQGMGVGLSISRTIIESHGGRIMAEPNPDGGAIFRFSLRRIPPQHLENGD